MTTSTESLCARLEGLRDNATSGPWKHIPVERKGERVRDEIVSENGRWAVANDILNEGDAIFIVELVNALPALLSAARAGVGQVVVPRTEPVDENDLRSWGYAPGGYIFKCHDCPDVIALKDRFTKTGDKRSWRCEKHAREARDAFRANLAASVPKRAAAPATQPSPPAAGEIAGYQLFMTIGKWTRTLYDYDDAVQAVAQTDNYITAMRPVYLTPPAADAAMVEENARITCAELREEIRIAYKTGYNEGYIDATDDGTGTGYTDHDACEEGWQQYADKIGLDTEAPFASRQPADTQPFPDALHKLQRLGQDFDAREDTQGGLDIAAMAGHYLMTKTSLDVESIVDLEAHLRAALSAKGDE